MATREDTTLKVDDGAMMPMVVFQATADSAGPAVLFVPAIYGVADDLVSQMEEVAAEGVWVGAMDPFFRLGGGVIPYDQPDDAIARVQKLDKGRCYRDFTAATEEARKAGHGKVIVVGVCFGAPFAFLGAAGGFVHGVVTWHGSRLEQYLDITDRIRCPMRLHFGDSDAITPPEVIDAVKEALQGHKDVEIQVHPGAAHGFSHRSGKYHDEAAEAASLASVIELVRLLS